MTKMLGSLAALALLAPLTASADPLPKPVEGMKCMVGTWHGTGTVTMGKEQASFKATWTCKPTSQKWGLVCSMHATGVPGIGTYDETDLMGYDAGTNTYHWYAVTNAGETHDHVAPVSSDNTTKFVYQGTQDGKPFKELIDMTFGKDSKSLTGRSESFVDGSSTSVMTFALHK